MEGFISILAVLVSALFVYYSSKKLEIWSKEIGRRAKRATAAKDEELRDLLTRSRWRLNFNPKKGGAEKIITFLTDGSIGEGQNKNEWAWRLKDGLLEIINFEARLYSRFSYDSSSGFFHHTNDEDTISIRSQIIFPEEAAG